MKSKKIRNIFLNFFKKKKHKIISSSSILAKNDPTLMFTNSGMNQFKNFFIGNKKSTNLRIANTQKCLRIIGKHNDLENVGYDNYHHTMFEMLGNWSFGDYFKKEAINWCWELLTEVYKISPNDIYISLFGGDIKENLSQDKESFNYWKKIINNSQILFFDKKKNFWEMGSIGPCGVSSEIHIDIRDSKEKKKIFGGKLVNQNHPGVIELYNIVFIEFLRKNDGSLEKLPYKHVDTGMGLERLSMVLQKKNSSYETDLFYFLIKKIEKLSNIHYGNNFKQDIAVRIIVDHIRAISFAIADGKIPSKNGSGYVIRRLLRRALSYSYLFLKKKDNFFNKIISTLCSKMGIIYPELIKNKRWIKNIILEEEKKFFKNFLQCKKKMLLISKKIKNKKKKIIDGIKIFKLHDTYGLPIEISRIFAKKEGLKLNEDQFKIEMEKQKKKSNNYNFFPKNWILIHKNENNIFLGFDKLKCNIFINKYRKIKKNNNIYYQLVFNKTPFYPRGGGQIGDIGYIKNNKEKINIIDTIKENDIILHIVNILPKNINLIFKAKVNKKRRKKIEINHTFTHILHYSLRKVLGKHVKQKGSYIGPDYLHFDFYHYKKLNLKEFSKIEKIVYDIINNHIPIKEKRCILLKKALSYGAIGLLNKKYKKYVRIIQFGHYIELCGGTHIKNTKKIKFFHIKSESSISLGIRRIKVFTENTAINYLKKKNMQYQYIINKLNTQNILNFFQKIKEKNKKFKKIIKKINIEKNNFFKKKWISQSKNISSIILIKKKTKLEINNVKNICLNLIKRINNLFMIIGILKKQPIICIAISNKILENININAKTIIKKNFPFLKIKGNNFFSLSRVESIYNLDVILNTIEKYIFKILK